MCGPAGFGAAALRNGGLGRKRSALCAVFAERASLQPTGLVYCTRLREEVRRWPGRKAAPRPGVWRRGLQAPSSLLRTPGGPDARAGARAVASVESGRFGGHLHLELDPSRRAVWAHCEVKRSRIFPWDGPRTRSQNGSAWFRTFEDGAQDCRGRQPWKCQPAGCRSHPCVCREGTESWCFSVEEMKGVCISAFARSTALSLSFLGHLYSCQAGTPGMGAGEGSVVVVVVGEGGAGRRLQKKEVVKPLWPAWRHFRSATGKMPGF